MPPDLIIRPATPDDAPEMNAYMRRLVDEPHNNVGRDPGQWDKSDKEERKLLADYAQDPGKAFLVALRNGQIAGILNITRLPRPTEVHVAELGLSVDLRHRRTGVGLALMHAAIAWATEKNLRRVQLRVFTRNLAAIALYEKLGFVREGIHFMVALKQGIWVDDYTMAFMLDPEPSTPDGTYT